MLTRRKMIVGLLATPAIVKISSLMTLRGQKFQYFPWGVVLDGHVVRLYDQAGNGADLISEFERAPAYVEPGYIGFGDVTWVKQGAIFAPNIPKPTHFWGTRLLDHET